MTNIIAKEEQGNLIVLPELSAQAYEWLCKKSIKERISIPALIEQLILVKLVRSQLLRNTTP
ncbi:hypothetical protein [Akkermansia sp.]|uniref:hypothetical protein n=1 Tax=Akkermansia sp. TaxID=1872421 RepID=UPI0025C1D378|nr:hypothetical protein [Akkermansia sp.]MCC8147461.1 hypothetical protein [Akkermansia sp.]